MNVDTIIQNVVQGVAELSFSVPRDDVAATRRAVVRTIELLGEMEVSEDDSMGKISLVGAGMRSHPGVTATFFGAIADAGVNIEMISTSEIRISVVVDENLVDAAVTAAHTAFDLDDEHTQAVVYGGTGR